MAVRSFPERKPGEVMSSPGGEETGEGEVKTILKILLILSKIACEESYRETIAYLCGTF